LPICQSASITADITISGATPRSSPHTSDAIEWTNLILQQRRIKIDELLTGPHAEIYQFLRDSLEIIIPRQLAWHVINQSHEIPKCPCGNFCNWARTDEKYRNACSNKCAGNIKSHAISAKNAALPPKITPINIPWHQDPIKKAEALRKRKENCLKKYGVEHHALRADVREKTKKTNVERYGGNSPSNSPQVLEKIKKSFQNKYPPGSDEMNNLISQTKKTILDRYGVDHPMKVKEFRNKYSDSMIKNHGTIHPLQNLIINQKRKDTNLIRYGVEEATKSNHVKHKKVMTNQEKYGVDYAAQRHYSEYTKSILIDPILYEQELSGKTLDQAKEHLNVSLRTILNYAKVHNLRNVFSPVKDTKIENKIQDLLDTLIGSSSYIKDSRKIIPPYELDFYITGSNLAIEVNGLYWHCENGGTSRNKTYHQNKWKLCLDQNITLLQFTQNDIENNFHLVESRIKRYLDIPSKVIGARKLSLDILNNFNVENEFFDRWHLQGGTSNRNFVISAKYNNQLVGICSWKYKDNSAELVRFATNSEYSFPGLLSRMINKFVKETQFSGTILSYSNNMYSGGKAYNSTGFINAGITPPGYFYTKHYTKLESRISYQKHKLFEKFNLDPLVYNEKSEWQIMQEMGYDRFWDAGHSRWIKVIT
jgi:hypothetical protein